MPLATATSALEEEWQTQVHEAVLETAAFNDSHTNRAGAVCACALALSPRSEV